jgi:gliding motility-associated-like protein
MPKFNDISDFENLLKEQMSGHSTPPPIDAWTAISSSTAQTGGIISSLTTYFNASITLVKTGLIISSIGTIGVVGYLQTVNSIDIPQPKEETTLSVPESITTNSQSTFETIESSDNTTKSPNENRTSRRVDSKKINPSRSTSIPLTVDTSSSTPKNYTNQPIKTIENKGSTSPRITASNYNPCVGETVVLKASENGDWFLNETKVASNTAAYNAQCRALGIYTYFFKTSDIKAQTILTVSEFNGKIVKDHVEDGRYSFSLSNQNLIANWFINDKLYSTNTPFINITLETVGKHQIKAVVINHPCAKTLTFDVQLAPIGHFEAINIFTVGNDGLNDTYKVNISGYDNFSLQIFNSNSNLVFSTLDSEEGWDGRINNEGIECPQGEYFARVSFKLKGELPQIKNIKLTLLRP